MSFFHNDSTLKSNLLSAIVSSSDDAIISKDLNGDITSWNKAAESIFGWKENEIIGKNILTIVPADKVDEEKYIISQIKQGNKVDHFETIRQKKDGTLFPVSVTISPIKDGNGKIIGASKILRDNTNIKEDEEKKAILVAIVKSSDDAIISKTLDGIITSWNPAAEKMFGYSESEILGKSITVLIPKDRVSEEKEIISRIKLGVGVEHYETIRLNKNGNPVNVSITVSPIKDSKGNVIGASKIARDISYRLEVEKKLEEQTNLLKHLNAAKDEFIGIASHELKTPITSIQAYLQLMERSIKDPVHKEYIERTLRHIGKLGGLVSDLLDVSKIEAGKLQLNIQPVDLNEMITQTIEAMNHTNESHKVVRQGEIKPVIVEVDPLRIEQVLNNFFTNAIKYSPDADKVIVRLEEKEKHVIFSVQDFGIGMQKENLNMIFSRFYRVEGLAPTFSGLGIGLYISHEIIERHRGKIWVDSEPGKGSTFYFSIPCEQS